MIPPRIKLCIARYRLGCAWLHFVCMVRSGNRAWHMQCIRGELHSLRPWALGCLVVALGFAAPGAAGSGLFREKHRPQYHFTPERNWMNDPNGMVYYEGEYHLFYQYNPFGDKWGHMSWGHAVSTDMLHWKQLPVALAEEDGVMIFSGSAVIDWKNTSGFGKNGKPAMIAIYTGRRNSDDLQTQCLAFSNDKGRTWTKYSGNPVIDIGSKNFRDPKVFWHEESRNWVMVVALSEMRKVRLYKSPDLKRWTQTGEFGPEGSIKGIWECPDLFLLKAADGKEKWVLIVNIGSGSPAGGSGTQYFVGTFDGNTFRSDPAPAPSKAVEPAGQIFADFESATYGAWEATGEAFGTGPAKGTLPNQMSVSGFQGSGLVNSFYKGDASQGTLISPEFEVQSDYINFLVGGGAHAGKTCVNLLVDGQPVRTATGSESETIDWYSWSVAELKGCKARIEIVDRESGGWGHINVDQITFASAPAIPASEPALWADYGRDFYAGVSWSDVPESDGRRLWLGWMSNWQYAQETPTSPWRSAMSLPRELVLARDPEGYRLRQAPVRELDRIRARTSKLKIGNIHNANEWVKAERLSGNTVEIAAEFDGVTNEAFGLNLLKSGAEQTVLRVEPRRKMLVLDRSASGNTLFHARFDNLQQAPLSIEGKVRLHVFVDACSVEVFADSGKAAISSLVFPRGTDAGIEFFGPESLKVSAEVSTLKSVWKSK